MLWSCLLSTSDLILFTFWHLLPYTMLASQILKQMEEIASTSFLDGEVLGIRFGLATRQEIVSRIRLWTIYQITGSISHLLLQCFHSVQRPSVTVPLAMPANLQIPFLACPWNLGNVNPVAPLKLGSVKVCKRSSKLLSWVKMIEYC